MKTATPNYRFEYPEDRFSLERWRWARPACKALQITPIEDTGAIRLTLTTPGTPRKFECVFKGWFESPTVNEIPEKPPKVTCFEVDLVSLHHSSQYWPSWRKYMAVAIRELRRIHRQNP